MGLTPAISAGFVFAGVRGFAMSDREIDMTPGELLTKERLGRSREVDIEVQFASQLRWTLRN